MDQATVLGLEIDLRKKLSFISLLKNIKVGLNFTYVYSEVNIDSLELVAIRATDPNANDTRQMSGQSPYIINASIGYHNTDIGLDANLVYNVAGPKLIIVVKGGTPDIFQQPYNSINFVATKTISKHFLLSIKATNLLNPNYKQTYTYKNKEYISRQYTKGRVFELGIAYSIR